MILKHVLLLLFFISTSLNIFANPVPATCSATTCPAPAAKSPIVRERSLPALGVTELTLANGIRVCLKPTTFDDEEILVHLFAPGGFAMQGPAKRASVELAPAVAWESGIGGQTAQQWSTALFDSEVDLAPRVGPYDHSIEGSVPPENLSDLMRMLGKLYTSPKFSPEAADKVKVRLIESAKHQSEDEEELFEYAIKAVNSGDLPALRALTKKEIDTLDYRTAESFYRHVFLDPKDLTCVLVGDFTLGEIKPLIIQHLASIPAVESHASQALELESAFPKEMQQRYVASKTARDSLTRITFCLEGQTDPEDLPLWETITQVLETRLRKVFLKEVGSTHGIDVALELPLHPSCHPTWLTLQFRCDPVTTSRLTELALKEVRRLQSEGPKAEDLQIARELQQVNDSFWEGNNSYWLALISNCYRQNMPLEGLQKASAAKEKELETIGAALRSVLDLKRYTVVTLGPNNS